MIPEPTHDIGRTDRFPARGLPRPERTRGDVVVATIAASLRLAAPILNARSLTGPPHRGIGPTDSTAHPTEVGTALLTGPDIDRLHPSASRRYHLQPELPPCRAYATLAPSITARIDRASRSPPTVHSGALLPSTDTPSPHPAPGVRHARNQCSPSAGIRSALHWERVQPLDGHQSANSLEGRETLRMNDVFVLGAGFSKAIDPAMPTLPELSREVIRRLRRLTFPIPAPLNKLDENIELWITYLSQRQPWLTESDNDYNQSLAAQIRKQIAEIIEERTATASHGEAPAWLRDLIRSWHQTRATVITLNYDTLIERASRRVQVSGNMNQISTSHMYPPYLVNVRARSGVGLYGGNEIQTLSLLKLHGSVNWYYSGRIDFFGEDVLFAPVGYDVGDNENIREPASRDKEILIIPPLLEKTRYFNNETVRKIWQEAGDALERAARVYIIGYSFPDSDLAMRFFVRRHLRSHQTEVSIVNIDSEIAAHYEEALDMTVSSEFCFDETPVELFSRHYSYT